ncbi:hypothetical protein KP003_03065 [Geomonas nitrogeniifigens]|uniref:Uncharacterized protein n=1 Tax=Geomonas diazotrophica TaxID=2843197 RepID=A0ABX8JNN4_9BACT|nr:hypothetical protein [Geomonas nitrogeniifigens]QWV98217.1 hypothetical protein KP005_02690 [Geomonas nitrogeniifigens]QXE87403.1 hypothetical protein KP003_03065 [Geomonas nitrogeniifigens]
MRKIMTAALVLLTATVLMGMGSLGGAPEGEVPKTDENIKVQLTDRSGVKIELTRFSMNGKVFIEGKRGAGEMSVFFHDLKEIGFGPVNGDAVPADLLLKSGRRVQLSIRTGAVFHGDTGEGAYQISAPNISRIQIH